MHTFMLIIAGVCKRVHLRRLETARLDILSFRYDHQYLQLNYFFLVTCLNGGIFARVRCTYLRSRT